MFRYCLPAAVVASFSVPVLADVPVVATDIAPVHALVTQVMAGVGMPELIIPPRASPHGYAMRPSEARALNAADLVVWVGPSLTPWLAEPIETLAGSATHLTLMDQPGTHILPFREGATFEAHDHDDEGHAAEQHGDEDHGENHDDHEEDHAGHDHAADDHAGHDHDTHEGHAHGGNDPHVWLDPRNGQLWLGQIAEALAERDPDNAKTYLDNALAAQEELARLETEITAQLAPLRGRPFIVFHDAYHYFEARFDIEAAGAISENDARAPGAARLAELRAVVSATGATCVFAEPQFNPGLVAAIADGQAVKTGTLDPLGAALTPGAALYRDLLRGMADSMAACLSE
tara:strand:- start:44174 stop:45211 length:1038 start_codon:yes stop_codon:yes gene_type:complete